MRIFCNNLCSNADAEGHTQEIRREQNDYYLIVKTHSINSNEQAEPHPSLTSQPYQGTAVKKVGLTAVFDSKED